MLGGGDWRRSLKEGGWGLSAGEALLEEIGRKRSAREGTGLNATKRAPTQPHGPQHNPGAARSRTQASTDTTPRNKQAKSKQTENQPIENIPTPTAMDKSSISDIILHTQRPKINEPRPFGNAYTGLDCTTNSRPRSNRNCTPTRANTCPNQSRDQAPKMNPT